MASRIIQVERLGRMQYMKAWEYQKSVAATVHNNVKMGKEAQHKLLLVEHDPVYTTGIRKAEYTPEVEAELRATGADFYHTNRGGLITFHGPGQLVAYPILHLKSFSPGIKWYVCSLERTIIRTLQWLGINANTSPHTGVWVGDNKICALGLQGRHVTTHGIGLNCNTDLHWFNHIVPCGIPDKGVTSVSQELKRDVTIGEVEPLFLKAFSEIFKCQLEVPDRENTSWVGRLNRDSENNSGRDRYRSSLDKPGDWKCPSCQCNNFAKRTTCFECGAAKDGDSSPFGGDGDHDSGRDRYKSSNVKPGDWECPLCQCNNFAKRTICFECGAAKDGDSTPFGEGGRMGGGGGGGGKRKMMPGDWTCSKCKFHNFASRTMCYQCSAPRGRSGNRVRAGDWECPQCHFHNFASRVKCFQCSAIK